MMSNSLAVVCARVRMPLLWAGLGLGAAGLLVPVPEWLPVALLAVGMALYLRVGRINREPITVAPPVAGSWLAINSPANRVPSHGLHAYGQTYAVDLVHDPAGAGRPPLRWTPFTKAPGEFVSFGQPILAPADGVVVRVHDRERDHRSRDSWPAVLFLLIEAGLRELTGPGRILGNHVVIDLGDGVYAALAHLKRGSITVRKGQRVAAGEQLAECGNSGNSSEPHLHFQLMDHRSTLFAGGLPFRFGAIDVGGELTSAMPRHDEPFVAHGAAVEAGR